MRRSLLRKDKEVVSSGREDLNSLDDIGVVDPFHDLDFSAEVCEITFISDGARNRLYSVGLTDNRATGNSGLNVDALRPDDNAKLAPIGSEMKKKKSHVCSVYVTFRCLRRSCRSLSDPQEVDPLL